MNLKRNKKLRHLNMQVATHVFALCESQKHPHQRSVPVPEDTGYLL
ncbi:hypothetical protein P20311_0011 [Pseudoalteromonas sp. BSi20311]|nr:hypothetical protein [Pseudoalteromonas sp. BSi20311]GAA62246.1 hypothetical protein P20311_0011 [Pseudoalteromonas sp. BSi20311]